MHITSKSNFFANDLKIKIEEEAIIFKVAGLDDRKTQKASFKNGQYHLNILAETKEGKFDFDVEESDCDTVVVYCR